MERLLNKLEKERQKLNELGEVSLKQSIPLSDNPDVMEQSREVDAWMVRYLQRKARQQRMAKSRS